MGLRHKRIMAAKRRLEKPDTVREERRRCSYKQNFGITIEQYEYLLETQGGRCAVCGEAETIMRADKKGVRGLAVDHCHATGKVRGLL